MKAGVDLGPHAGFVQFCSLYLEEQASRYMDDWEPDYYACAERWIAGCRDIDLEQMLQEIDALFALSTEQERRAAIPHPLNTVEETPGAWDAFLHAFRARAEREQVGDLSQPLVHPDPSRLQGRAISPQGWDNTLPSAGSFSSEAVAEAVVDAVLKSYGDRVAAFFQHSRPGVARRLPPMRMRFDRDVGLVAVRDGEPVRTRLAVVLLHDVGGQAHVYSSFPMEEVPEPPRMEALFILLGGWLHADWVDEQDGIPDPLEQVRRFAANEPAETVAQAAAELDALRSTGTEDGRRRAVRGFCCFFLPRPAGQLDAFLAESAQILGQPRR